MVHRIRWFRRSGGSRHHGVEALGDVAGLIFGVGPGFPAGVLAEPTPDPGLFGPQSVTWRIAAEPALLVGSLRALLLQVAHPLIAEAVERHSDYRRDPYGRLLRTLEWLVAVVFGTTGEARAAIAALERRHRPVRGVLSAEGATARHPAGEPYAADDSRLARWVHATIVDSILATYEALVTSLDEEAGDAVVREWDVVLRAVVPSAEPFGDARSLRGWMAEEVRSGAVEPGLVSRRAARVVLESPVPARVLAPVLGPVRLVGCGLLPAEIRAALGIPWTPTREAAFRWLCAASRHVHRALPRQLRTSAVARRAQARTRPERAATAAGPGALAASSASGGRTKPTPSASASRRRRVKKPAVCGERGKPRPAKS
jgi:uncharacterized protein (DUF2236 family)